MRARSVPGLVHIVGILGALALVLLTAFTGDADAVDPSIIQDNAEIPVALSHGSTATQSLMAQHDRLHALEVRWIVSPDFRPAPDGVAILHLRERRDGPDIRTAALPLAALQNNAYGKFTFAPIPSSGGRIYYFSFDVPARQVERGAVALWASQEDAFAGGELYLDDVPAGSDLVMRAYYEPDVPMLLADLARQAGRYGPGLAALTLLCGLVGSVFVPLSPTFSIPSLILAGLAALSAAGVALLISPLDSTLLVVVALALALLGVVRLARSRAAGLRITPQAWLWVLLWFLALTVGLEQIRDTDVPLWVDSVTHAQIIQLLLGPGLPSGSSFYHFGFHTVTALLAGLAGLPVPTAMLLMGPFLLTVCGLSAARLSHRLTGSLVAAVVSAICVWFLSPTPSYFITWGRYPLLLGAALLPLALASFVDWIEADKPGLPSALTPMVLLGGLAFAHVRLVVFYLAFMVVYLAVARFSPSARPHIHWLRLVLPLVAGAVFAALWVGAVLLRGLSPAALVAENTIVPVIDLSTAVAVSMTHHGRELVAMAALSALVCVLRRSRTALLVLAWYFILTVVAYIARLDALGSLVSPDLIVLMGFIPVALIVGETAGWLWERVLRSDSRHRTVAVAALGLVVLLGARDMVSVVNPATISFTGADSRAIDALRSETPAGAPILVNSFNWYASTYVPSDGGAWLPFFEGHPTVFLDVTNADLATRSDALADWMQARQVTLVYVGWKGGILSRTVFECSPRFTLLYARDGITIFRLVNRTEPAFPHSLPPNCSLQG